MITEYKKMPINVNNKLYYSYIKCMVKTIILVNQNSTATVFKRIE